MTLSFPVTTTPQGTSVKIHFEGSALAAVPEENSLVLTGLGILGLLLDRSSYLEWKKSRRDYNAQLD
jgi:hypothetical protein